MALAEYMQRGEVLDYVNAGETAIDAGEIVTIGARIGVAGAPIAPGETGAIHVSGVWTMPKTGTAAVDMGQTVYWDGTGVTDEADDGETEPTAFAAIGYAAADAAADATEITVKLCG